MHALAPNARRRVRTRRKQCAAGHGLEETNRSWREPSMAHDGFVELQSRPMKARIDGALRLRERLGYLGHGHSSEFDQHENVALVLVERFEQSLDDRQRLMTLGEIGRRSSRVGHRFGQSEIRRVPPLRATMVVGYTPSDLEQPSAKRTPIERIELPMNDDEDVLHGIFDRGI